MATMMELAEEIIKGRRITKDDDLSIFLTCDLDELRAGADKIREYFIGEDVDLCSIINGRATGAADARRTVSSVHSLRTIIQTVRCMISWTRRRSWRHAVSMKSMGYTGSQS